SRRQRPSPRDESRPTVLMRHSRGFSRRSPGPLERPSSLPKWSSFAWSGDASAAHLVAEIPEDVPREIDAGLDSVLRQLPHGPVLLPVAGRFYRCAPLRTTTLPMRIVSLVGNRPQFVKAAAVSRRLRDRHTELLVHSGQHYDDELSAIFFRELGLPAPDRWLGVGSGPNAEQVAGIMHAFEPEVDRWRPDPAPVYGDTNTTLAGALSCARLGVPLAHVEAGMRSFDWSMPEERNRVLTDHVSDLCLCSTRTAVSNL